MTHQPGVYVPLRALFLVVCKSIIKMTISRKLVPRNCGKSFLTSIILASL